MPDRLIVTKSIGYCATSIAVRDHPIIACRRDGQYLHAATRVAEGGAAAFEGTTFPARRVADATSRPIASLLGMQREHPLQTPGLGYHRPVACQRINDYKATASYHGTTHWSRPTR